MPLEEAIPTIPIDAIRPFLSYTLVVGEDALDDAPYVMQGVDDRLMSGEGHRVYARGFQDTPQQDWSVVRKGEAFLDPETDEVIGYEARYIGDARVIRLGDPATMLITASRQEILTGDRLIEPVPDFDRGLQPHAPYTTVNGSIVAQLGGAEQIAQYNVVVLNRGTSHGLQPGTVVSIWREGEMTRDSAKDRGRFSTRERVRLPDERYGEAIVFRADDTVSLALVMRSSREMAVGDLIRNP
jgi:hypothetical protein